MHLKQGTFLGWVRERQYGFITPDGSNTRLFLPMKEVIDPGEFLNGVRVSFSIRSGPRGDRACDVRIVENAARALSTELGVTLSVEEPRRTAEPAERSTLEHDRQIGDTDDDLLSEEVEKLETKGVRTQLLQEISQWKREAKAEDNGRYFWHIRETDEIANGDKYFVIGRKGSGKTAICEYFNRQRRFDVFAEKLSFKNFPFNDLYAQKNAQFTSPNQFITIWKYLIYSTVCRLMLKNQAISDDLRSELARLYKDDISLSRRMSRWVGKEFGLSLLGISLKVTNTPPPTAKSWIDHVDFLEDLLLQHAGQATYFVLFDELDEDYRELVESDQSKEYAALITSLFKAVQDIRTLFDKKLRVYPVVFLRDDIYDLVQDSDKNKWGDFRVDLSWDVEKIKRLIAFRVSRAIDGGCQSSLSFEAAWSKVFGVRPIGIGQGKKKTISTFEFIERSTLLRPRDFVTYLQNCAEYSVECGKPISPEIVRFVDKGFSNYLRQELTDELFAILPDIANIFDAVSQLRKWTFSIPELETAYLQQVDNGFIKQANVKFVLQVLFLFSVIGNMPRAGRYVFRYKNQAARLNFNERVVVHRGLFKSLQIL